MSILAGSIHGLVGENGAGKSTLGKIIGGAVVPSGGTILIDGERVSYRAPREALADGIAVIQQELALVPEMTVADNVFLGTESARGGAVSRPAMRRRWTELEQRAQFGLDPDTIVADLSVAQQQKVEILRAIARDARLIVMDEPTSSLAREETEQLHALVRGLRDDGITIVYVSHFLEEVLALCDTVTVFRNGELVETLDAAGTTVDRLVVGMLGHEMSTTFPAKQPPPAGAETVLSVRGISRAKVLEDISFEVRRGEIVGLAGLVGSGRSEVARAIFGADPVDSGTVEVDGAPLKLGSPRRAIAAGIALAPEDRKRQGLLLELPQRDNVALPNLATLSRLGFTDRRREDADTRALLAELGVTPPDPARPVRTLSGGNQQKVLFAKWLLRERKVLILDEPTRGVDVGAKRAIYELIVSLAERGLAVVVISSELEEVLGLAHRVLVMRRGRIATELTTDAMSPDAVMHAAFGIDAIESEIAK
ncbi:MAG: sugar ABC transporter ATP-binding protein [Solirubrobacterales bacterium]|nr:sugar ABC transporter ATP-binding protein [Solirubrobacterales bacterium]